MAKEERTEGTEAALYFDDRPGGRVQPRVLTASRKWRLQGGSPEALAAAKEMGVTTALRKSEQRKPMEDEIMALERRRHEERI